MNWRNDRCGRTGRKNLEKPDCEIRIKQKVQYGIISDYYYFGFDFDYINGFHDAANSIATIVSTKVLTPFQAVIWAVFFKFCCIL